MDVSVFVFTGKSLEGYAYKGSISEILRVAIC